MRTQLLLIAVGLTLVSRGFGQFRVEASAWFYTQLEASWELVVDESGNADYRVWGNDGADFRRIRLTQATVERLRDTINEVRFFEFSDALYGWTFDHGLHRTIRVIDGEKKKQIKIGWLDGSEMSDLATLLELERVAMMWRTIRALVPDQDALDYRQEDERALREWRRKANKALDPTRVGRPATEKVSED